MKTALALIAVTLFAVTSNAQSQTLSKEEYDKAFQFAVSETNADYPFIFKVITTFIENGKTVRTETEVRENESQERSRIKMTVLAGGRQKNKYQVSVAGNVFCSDNGVYWKPSQYECSFGPIAISAPRAAESTEYSVTEKSVEGKKVKVYREYSVFASSGGSKKKDFIETVSTIDSRGFFLTVEDTEGTLAPRKVTLTRKQSWITKAEIVPVVSPIK